MSPRPGAMVVDLSSARDLRDAIAEVERVWVAMPPPLRRKLSRFLLLDPSGQVVAFRPPCAAAIDAEADSEG